MKIERNRFIVMRNNRTEIWCGNSRNFKFKKLDEVGKVNIVSYHSEKQANACCSSWERDFEIVPIKEILAVE